MPLRYERGTEFVDVVFGLWDSFEADALLLDRETGVYYDKTSCIRSTIRVSIFRFAVRSM
jgi:hypothetical protein